MSVLNSIVRRASQNPKRIALSEGEDVRVIEGAVRASREGIAKPILIGDPSVIEPLVSESGGRSSLLEIVNHRSDDRLSGYIDAYFAHREKKGATRESAAEALADPMVFAAMMVRMGDADGTVGGAVKTTGHTVRVALQTIGPAAGVRTVSSFFLMEFAANHHPYKGAMVFSDCGLVIEPSSSQLADIAVASAFSYQSLTGDDPRIALLSFSTKGSASHERIDKVTAALDQLRNEHKELAVDGELQFDAAIIPSVAKSKAPGSPVAGNANVMIFPNLEAGNIGYKIAERVGGATAVGPILQGLAKPANDLSRGCNADDVFHAIAITGLQGG